MCVIVQLADQRPRCFFKLSNPHLRYCLFHFSSTFIFLTMRYCLSSLCCCDLQVGDSVSVHVDYDRRSYIAPNHTMTHVLNYALRSVLVGNGTCSICAIKVLTLKVVKTELS